MSIFWTIVTSRLRSELCHWGVNLILILLKIWHRVRYKIFGTEYFKNGTELFINSSFFSNGTEIVYGSERNLPGTIVGHFREMIKCAVRKFFEIFKYD